MKRFMKKQNVSTEGNKDNKDQPFVDAQVVAIPDATRRKRRDLYAQGNTDQRGHFTLHGVNPGEYSVIAFEDLEDDPHDPDFIKSYEGRGQNMEIKEGERKTVLLRVVVSTDEQPQLQDQLSSP